jgi:hypothetical protein
MKLKPYLQSSAAAFLGLLLLAGSATSSHADVLLRYEMNDENPNYENVENLVDGSFLLWNPGSLFSLFLPSTQPYPTTPVFSAGPAAYLFETYGLTNSAEALAGGVLIQFDFTVGSGVTNLVLDRLTFDGARGGGATNRGYGVYITTPTTTDEQVGVDRAFLTARPVWDPQTIDLSGITSLQGLNAGQTVTVKIPFWASTNQTIELDNITLHGYANNITNELPFLPLEITDYAIVPNTSATLTWLSNEGAGFPGQSTGLLYTVQYSMDLNGGWSVLKSDIPADGYPSTTEVLNLTGAGAGLNATVLQYQMGTTNAQLQDAANLVTGSGLTPGDGLNTFNTLFSGGNYPSQPVLTLTHRVTTADVAAALANTNWFTFTLTVGTNVTDLDLNSLSFNAARGGAAGPRGYAVDVTTPTTTNQEVQPATILNTARPIWDPQNIDLSSFASLQNLTAGQSVTFRVLVFAPTTGSSLEFDDITIKADVSPDPIPDYVGAAQLFLRVRQQ